MQVWGQWLLGLFLFNPVNEQVACAALGNCQGLFTQCIFLASESDAPFEHNQKRLRVLLTSGTRFC